eukprot:3411465-Alexandrium_andersonii.AAC.1
MAQDDHVVRPCIHQLVQERERPHERILRHPRGLRHQWPKCEVEGPLAMVVLEPPHHELRVL